MLFYASMSLASGWLGDRAWTFRQGTTRGATWSKYTCRICPRTTAALAPWASLLGAGGDTTWAARSAGRRAPSTGASRGRSPGPRPPGDTPWRRRPAAWSSRGGGGRPWRPERRDAGGSGRRKKTGLGYCMPRSATRAPWPSQAAKQRSSAAAKRSGADCQIAAAGLR